MKVRRRSSFFILTNAPATGAPEGSLTTPCKTPERSCAVTAYGAKPNERTAMKRLTERGVSMTFLLPKKKARAVGLGPFCLSVLAARRFGVPLERLELEHRGAVVAADPERHGVRRIINEDP